MTYKFIKLSSWKPSHLQRKQNPLLFCKQLMEVLTGKLFQFHMDPFREVFSDLIIWTIAIKTAKKCKVLYTDNVMILQKY